jgi:cellulose synthase/poly-beta-1,6-N-acetylglucosamine synthase-like glycosyltransferase
VLLEPPMSNNDVIFSNSEVGISIIISVKNEEKNIKTNVNSLKNLEYQEDNFEVIFVDDHSEDDTSQNIKDSIKDHQNFKLILLSKAEAGGKRNALKKGIEKTRFEYILITDADCRPDPKWLKAYSKKFSLEYDFLFGIAPFEQDNSQINKIACYENLRNSILTFAFAGLGIPYSAAARNFGFTKYAFETVGGYSKTKQAISGDDDLLLREAVKNRMKISTVTDTSSYVYSQTEKTFKDYLKQKARHTQTSFHYLTKHRLLLGFWHILNLFSLLSVLLMFFNPIWGILPASKLIIDSIVAKLYQKKFTYRFDLFERIYLQIIYEVMLVINFINSIFMKIVWK